MKTGFKLLLLFVAVIGLTATTVLTQSSRAFAQSSSSATINPSDISAAYFNRGYLKKAANGLWEEYDGRGTLRYTFREARRDINSVYLREDQLNVDLQIDAVNRMIYGAWPGQPRHQLYRITNLEIEAPTISTPPPPPPPPPVMPEPPTPGPVVDNMVTGQTLAVAKFPSGQFQKTGISSWMETTSSGATHNYAQLGVDRQNVYLFDQTRNRFVQIDILDKTIRQGSGGEISALARNSAKFSAQAQATPPSEPETTLRPGTMSPEQRRQCAASGGTVERAGLLGAERCTKRFNDGGLICTDSSQCQGKCLADTGDANKNNITGTCQRTDNPFGCYAEVKNGTSDFALCVD